MKLSAVNEVGKEAVVAMLGPGDFFGEGCLAGQPIRIGIASAITPTKVLVIEKEEMLRLLDAEREFSDRFISHLLAGTSESKPTSSINFLIPLRSAWPEPFSFSPVTEKKGLTQKVFPRVSQETLAETIGTTRSRVNIFMNKFKKLGFIKYDGRLQIDSSLLSAVLRE